MPAATNRAELLTVTDKEWAKLTRLLEGVSDTLALQAQGEDPSIRDVIAHRAHWIGLFFQWLDEGAEAQMPDHGVKWSELKTYNAGLREKYADLSWEEAQARLTQAHGRLRGWIEGCDDSDLYGAPMEGGTGWTKGRYAEAAGPSHYRSAAKFVRAVVKRAG